MKKRIAVLMAAMMLAGTQTVALGAANGDITICSREDGSGTRGAFIELFGWEEKDADGKKVDNTTEAAKITNSTSVKESTICHMCYWLIWLLLRIVNSVTEIFINGIYNLIIRLTT